MLTRVEFIRLCRARDMLRETSVQPLSIREVARAAAVSPFQFIRRFHAMFGETPHQFRIQARLNRAKHQRSEVRGGRDGALSPGCPITTTGETRQRRERSPMAA